MLNVSGRTVKALRSVQEHATKPSSHTVNSPARQLGARPVVSRSAAPGGKVCLWLATFRQFAMNQPHQRRRYAIRRQVQFGCQLGTNPSRPVHPMIPLGSRHFEEQPLRRLGLHQRAGFGLQFQRAEAC